MSDVCFGGSLSKYEKCRKVKKLEVCLGSMKKQAVYKLSKLPVRDLWFYKSSVDGVLGAGGLYLYGAWQVSWKK